jgi:hypothetical protein
MTVATAATAETFTVVCTSWEDMEHLPPEMVTVYSVRFGEGFSSREQADELANRLNNQECGREWHHYSLTADEATAVLEECGTFQV